MALKIEQECDFSGKRASVTLPKSGPLDLGAIPTPDGWVERPGIQGVHDEATLLLCPEAAAVYDEALVQAEAAVKQVWAQAATRAARTVGNAPVAAPTGTHRSSSFAPVH